MNRDYQEPLDGEVSQSSTALVESGGLSVMARAEIDMQITTARAYPRRPKKVQDALVEMVTLDDEAAKECIYALPRGDKPIVGPSIRFAEALKQGWGNCRAASRISEVNRVEKYVEAEGVFHDLETNTVTRVTHRRRISGKSGKVFSDDMIMVTGNAAASVAMRESILKGVPRPVWRPAYEAVMQVIAGGVMTLSENREKAVKAFAIYGVKPEQVFAALGIGGDQEITLDHIVVLRGMFAAIKNGEAAVEDIFSKGEKSVDANYNPLVKETVDTDTGEITNSKPSVSSGQATPGGADKTNESSKTEQTLSTETVSGLSSGQGTEEAAPNQSQPDAAPPSPPSDQDGTGAQSAERGAAQDGSVAPHNAPVIYPFGDYARALARASQPKSLVSFDQQFRNANGWTTDEAALPTLRLIFALHQKKLKGEVKPDAFLAELKRLGAVS